MNWQQVLRQVIAVTLGMLFLVGCGNSAAPRGVDAPAARPALEPPTPTPISVRQRLLLNQSLAHAASVTRYIPASGMGAMMSSIICLI